MSNLLEATKKEYFKNIVLVESILFDEFKSFCQDYFPKDFEELTDANVNVKKQVLRYTTPIKYRGLESENVIIVTSGFTDRSRIQNYVAITRAIYQIHFIIWK
jgi:hypothetical protein